MISYLVVLSVIVVIIKVDVCLCLKFQLRFEMIFKNS